MTSGPTEEDHVPVSAADLERLAGLDSPDGSPVSAALARSRDALKAWGDAARDPSEASTMPGDVADRLDAVIAGARIDEGAPDGGIVTTLPTLQPRHNPNRNRWLSIAAAVVVIAGVGTGIGVTGGSHKKKQTTTVSTASGKHITLPAEIPVVTSTTNYATIDAVRQSVKALVTGALPAAPSNVTDAVRAAAAAAASGTAADSATGGVSNGPAPTAPRTGAGVQPAPPRSAVNGVPLSADLVGGDLALCLQHLADGQQIVGVERAPYKGKLSLIVAIRDPSVLDAVDIFIVGSSCDGLPPDGSGVRDTAQVQLN